jgi:transposase
MFVRRKPNKSGTVSVQIISKIGGKYKVLKSLGSAKTEAAIRVLEIEARQELSRMTGRQELFTEPDDLVVESFLSNLSNSDIQVIGPELVFGKIFDRIGYDEITAPLFRHLVITRLVSPGSKLKTIDYLSRYEGKIYSSDTIYRFLDTLHQSYKERIEQISFAYTKQLLGGEIGVVFYDMTTLYFEASDEDDLRRTGFSKDGKHQNPQIYLGLLVASNGYPVGYNIFEGNIYEGSTLKVMLEEFEEKFKLNKPVVIADAGLLSKTNLEMLQTEGYKFILGGRVKNESKPLKEKITARKWENNQTMRIKKSATTTLIVHYSAKRAAKDLHNRKRGLQRLEKRVKSGKLTKSNINNRGYNKYLKISGKVDIAIDYAKFEKDAVWDGLKGYMTNSRMSTKTIINQYKELWHIERAFRISKTDLRVRPIYHRLRRRIEAHICISFVAYSIYKELDRLLKKENIDFSVQKVASLLMNMYQITTTLPASNKKITRLLKMDEEQSIIEKFARNI